MLAFCNAVNTGVEPRKDLQSDAVYMLNYQSAYFGTFYLRRDDEEKPAGGLPEVPAQWRSYLLKKPVAGKVLSVDGQTATISLGSRQGLKIGMVLAMEGADAPSEWSGLKVVSVEETTSKVEVRDAVGVGKQVSTRYYPKKFE